MADKKEKIKKVHSKKFYIWLGVICATIVTLLTFFLVTWFCGCDTTLKYIQAYNYSYEENANIEVVKYPEQNYAEINNKTGEPLKILQLTDIHLGCGLFTITLDKKVVNEVFRCVEAVDPDIIVVTGDALSAIYVTSGTKNTYLQLDALIMLLEKLGRPYTFCFGNHDGDGLASKEYIAEKLESAPHSFFLRGERNITGVGNYYVKILDNGTLTSSMIFMDSGGKKIFGYEGVSADQVEWYGQTVNALKAEKNDIKNLLFMHVPIPEYDTFYDRWSAGDENYELKLGVKAERVCPGQQNGLYGKIRELDSTKWVFCGHDHTNNYAITEKSTNITLCYGMSMDYSAYPLLKFKTEQRGANVISVDSLGNVAIAHATQDSNYALSA
ncbi:MAG: metallophosphoesterase [Christensenellales bacterium]